jgi:hypothetical protein
MQKSGSEQPLVIHGLVLQRHSSGCRVFERYARRCVLVGVREAPETTSRVAIASPLEAAHRVSVASREASSVLPAAKC